MVTRRAWIEAIVFLREAGVERSIAEGQALVMLRREQLGLPLDRPDPTLDELVRRIDELRPELLAIEASWDGDTLHDWFVVLVAIVNDPAAPRGRGERWLMRVTGSVAAAARRAVEIGDHLAAHAGVRFDVRRSDMDPTQWPPRRDGE